MKPSVTSTEFEGLITIEPKYFEDGRGFFVESWNRRDFLEAGLDFDFVQDSHSRSTKGVLRGLHMQGPPSAMGKLVRCTLGAVFDVAVDLRMNSKTFGKWYGLDLSFENRKMIYIPEGFGHGFAVLSDFAEVQYKQTNYYDPSCEATLIWNDPEVGIKWPLVDPILSEKDKNGMLLAEYKKNPLF